MNVDCLFHKRSLLAMHTEWHYSSRSITVLCFLWNFQRVSQIVTAYMHHFALIWTNLDLNNIWTWVYFHHKPLNIYVLLVIIIHLTFCLWTITSCHWIKARLNLSKKCKWRHVCSCKQLSAERISSDAPFSRET